MPEKKKSLSVYFENISLAIVGILLFLFPLLFMSTTTDAFVLPKQLLLIALTTLALLFLVLKTLFEGKLKLRTSPFDFPVMLFLLVLTASAFFSVNRYDAFIASTPFLFAILLYFVILNSTRSDKQLLFLLGALTAGAAFSGLLTIFSFFNIYPLPFAYTKVSYFTTFGSMLDQSVYLALVLPIAGYFGYSFITESKPVQKTNPAAPFTTQPATVQKKQSSHGILFGIGFLIIGVALGLSVYMLMTTQKPLILPYETGLQTAMAAISQGTPSVFKSILFGSGYGTYLADFTQFKPAAYNANAALWSFTFFRSSSFILELLATTGLLGLAAFAFIVLRVIQEKNFFLPLILALIAAILLPFSFTLIALLFILLALFAIVTIHSTPHKYGEAEMHFVTLKKGLVALSRHTEHNSLRRSNPVLSIFFIVILLTLLAFPLYMTVRFTLSDLVFQRSLIAAAKNDGLQTYELQVASINIFPYRDIYYRSFSQTNLALANALATQQPKGASASAQVQKNILTLIQQSINSGRSAVTISPLTSFNWNNLSTIYRSLIGFGQNADKFTILTLNQAIALDPNNPQQYVDLGGVYYQLGQFDEAIKQFQTAVNLKPDYANAYYNLGHALEQKGDYDQALQVYQTVKQLVADNPTNAKKIDADIATLQNKAKQAQNGQQTLPDQREATRSAQPNSRVQTQNQIDVNQPKTQLPERNPRAEIPGPTINEKAPSPSPTTAQN